MVKRRDREHPLGNVPVAHTAEAALMELALAGMAVVVEYCAATDTTLNEAGNEVLHASERTKVRAVIWDDTAEAYRFADGVPEVVCDDPADGIVVCANIVLTT